MPFHGRDLSTSARCAMMDERALCVTQHSAPDVRAGRQGVGSLIRPLVRATPLTAAASCLNRDRPGIRATRFPSRRRFRRGRDGDRAVADLVEDDHDAIYFGVGEHLSGPVKARSVNGDS